MEASTSGVWQGSIWSPVLFNIFINDVDDGAGCTLSKLTHDTKLGGVTGTPEGCVAIQRDTERLEKWANKNIKEFNMGKCKLLHLRRNNLRHQDLLGQPN